MIQTMQSELFRIRKSRLFFGCLALAAFFVFALALTFYHNTANRSLPTISLVPFTEFLFSDYMVRIRWESICFRCIKHGIPHIRSFL